MKKRKQGKAETTVASAPSSRTGTMRGFSVYNREGDAYYKAEVERVAAELRAELYPPRKESAPAETREEVVVPKKRSEKRKFPLVLILLLNLFVLTVIVLSCFNLGGTAQIAPFMQKTASGYRAVSVLDGLMAKLSVVGLSSKLDYGANADLVAEIALIVFAAAGVLVTVLAVLQIVKSIATLAEKKERKNKHFGAAAFWSLVGIVLVLLSVIFLKAQFGFGDICSLLFPEALGEYGLPCPEEGYVLYSGYGMYVMLLAQIVTMICSACVYKKK